MASNSYEEFARGLGGGATGEDDSGYSEFVSGLGGIPARQPQVTQPPEKSGALRRVVGDTAVSALKSAISVPEAAVGLADIPTGGAVGRKLEQYGFRPKEAKATLEEMYSPEQRAINAELAQTKGFLPTTEYMLRHPSTLYHTTVESAAPMLAGGVAARGALALAPKLSPVFAGAMGEGTVGAGLAAEQIRQASPTGYLTPEQSLAALASGVGTAGIGAVGGKIAQRYGLGDVETMLARGTREVGAKKGAIRRVAEGALTEGAFEELPQSAQEQVWQNIAMGRPAMEGVPEAAAQGLLAGGIMGGGVNLISRAPAERLRPTETVSYPSRELVGMTPDLFTGEMGEGKDQYQAAMEDAVTKAQPTDAQMEMFAPRPSPGYATLVEGFKKPKAMTRREARAAARAEAVAAPAKPTKRQDIIATLDDHLANERITPEQHDMLMSDATDSAVKLTKLRKNIETAIAENQKTTEVAPVEAATSALDTFAEKLPKQQKAVFTLVKEAARNNELDKFISPSGEWQTQAIATALGLPKRQAAHKAIRDLRKKLDSEAGGDVKAALAAATGAVRTYEPAAEEMLGLSPAVQQSVVNQEDLFGSEEGAIQGMGTIESVGGAQGAVGVTELPPGYKETSEITPQAAAAARENRVRSLVEAAKNGDLAEAVNTWNDFVDILPGVEELSPNLSANEENIDFLADWVNAYIDVRSEVEATREVGKFIDEIGGYEYEVKRIVRERQSRAEKMVAAKSGAEKAAVGEKPAPSRGTGETGGVAEEPVTGAGLEKGVTVISKKRRALGPKMSISEEGEATQSVRSALNKAFFSNEKLDSVVTIVEEAKDLPTKLANAVLAVDGVVNGFYLDGHVYMIAKNITKGKELSTFLHEVGVHMGMKKLLGNKNYNELITQLQTWQLDGTGLEGQLAREAYAKVGKAEAKIGDKYDQTLFEEEFLAYFVGLAVERGVNPKAMKGQPAGLRAWFDTLMNSIKLALRKLGVNPEKLTAEDVVDLAYGAAQMELEEGGKGSLSMKMEVAETPDRSTVTYHSEFAMKNAEKALKKKGGYRTVSVAKTPEGTYEVTRVKLAQPKFSIGEGPEKITVEVTQRDGRKFIAESSGENAEKALSVAKRRWAGSDVRLFRKAPFEGAGLKFSVSEGMTIPEAVEWNKGEIKTAVANQAKHAFNVGLDKVMFTEDLVKRAAQRGLTSAKEFGRLTAEKMATRDQMEQEVANVMSRAFDLGKEKEVASAFIKDSTIQQKWGYTPEWNKDVEVDPGMKSRFDKLSPAAQAVVKDVFKFGNESHVRLQKAINQDIHDEFDALKATAETEEERADIEKRRTAKLAQVGKLIPKLDGPYAPLKRFGNHVFVAMSKEFAEAKKNNDTAAMEKLQDNERHLLVEHFTTRAEALARVDQLRNLYPGGSVDTWTKQESFKHISELPWAGVAKVKSAIEGLPEGSALKRSMQHMVTDLYLTMMAESSARKSEMQRKNVAGANKDMFRSFASQGSATAHFITSLENSGDISRAMVQMQTDAREGDSGTRNDRTAVLNELTARYAQSLQYSETPMVNRALKMTSFWMLITSPAFYFQNALQPFMITIPYLAGKFGANRSWSEMTKAYKDVSKYVIAVGTHQLDIDKLDVSAKEKEMLREMQKYGKLDLTIMQDMGRYTEGEGVLDKGMFGKVMRKIWANPQRIELLNRVASALAAYRLSGDMEYTGDVISKTHGNYSSFNAPRFFTKSGAMKLITQFRKFQLIQLTLLAKLTNDAFRGASAEEKTVARRSLYWMLGQHALLTGALGLPIPAIAWAIAASLGGDDGEDPEQWLRNMIGDEDAANLITRGVPAMLGMSISQKVGMGNAFSALPFADIPKDRAGYEKFLTASLGATAAIGGQWFDALGKIRQGEYYKGVETALPKGLKDMMKGYRFATDGVTSGAGDVLLKPEDVSLIDSFAAGMGLPTMTISERQRKQGVMIEAEKFYKDKTSNVKRAYVRAFKDKDREALAEVRAEWKELQNARVSQGFRRQPMSVLIKAPMEQRKRERGVVEGLATTKQNRGFAESLV